MQHPHNKTKEVKLNNARAKERNGQSSGRPAAAAHDDRPKFELASQVALAGSPRPAGRADAQCGRAARGRKGGVGGRLTIGAPCDAR